MTVRPLRRPSRSFVSEPRAALCWTAAAPTESLLGVSGAKMPNSLLSSAVDSFVSICCQNTSWAKLSGKMAAAMNRNNTNQSVLQILSYGLVITQTQTRGGHLGSSRLQTLISCRSMILNKIHLEVHEMFWQQTNKYWLRDVFEVELQLIWVFLRCSCDGNFTGSKPETRVNVARGIKIEVLSAFLLQKLRDVLWSSFLPPGWEAAEQFVSLGRLRRLRGAKEGGRAADRSSAGRPQACRGPDSPL